MEVFDDPETLNEKLDSYLWEKFSSCIEIDTMNEEITLPKIFETYKSDFGTDEDVLRFAWNYNPSCKFDIE